MPTQVVRAQPYCEFPGMESALHGKTGKDGQGQPLPLVRRSGRADEPNLTDPLLYLNPELKRA